jgi:hypothetical protein
VSGDLSGGGAKMCDEYADAFIAVIGRVPLFLGALSPARLVTPSDGRAPHENLGDLKIEVAHAQALVENAGTLAVDQEHEAALWSLSRELGLLVSTSERLLLLLPGIVDNTAEWQAAHLQYESTRRRLATLKALKLPYRG